MSAVFSSRVARRRAIAYVAVLAAALVMLAMSSLPIIRDLQRGLAFAFRPVVTAVDGFGHDVTSIAGAVGEIDQLRADNEALRLENEQLREQARRAAEIERQNELLTGLLQFRNGFEHATVAAAVIARDSSEGRQVIVLDRGTGDGISIGDVVVATGGALVGRVIDASEGTATVQLISDPRSTVIGQFVSTAATGEVTGDQPSGLIMGNIDAAVEVTLGDEVVTAGIELAGGIRSPYPKGLVIGQVIDVFRDANQIVQTAFLDPAAVLDRIEFVLVVTDYEGGLPPPEEQPTNCEPTDSGTIPGGEQPCIEPTPSAP